MLTLAQYAAIRGNLSNVDATIHVKFSITYFFGFEKRIQDGRF
jgi:hypothetical protein